VKKMLDGKRPFESREEILSRDTVTLIYIWSDQHQKTQTPLYVPASSKMIGRYFSDPSNKLRRMHTSGTVS